MYADEERMDGLGTAKEKRLESLGAGEVYTYTMH